MKSQIKKMIIFLWAVMMLTAVMCFGVSAESATCPNSPDSTHSWGDYNNSGGNRCSPDYWVDFVCYYCKENKRETGARHAYDWSLDVLEPTCTDDGYLREYCICGAYREKILYAVDHQWLTSDIKDATCTENGYKKMFCKYECGATEHIFIPATGHTYLNDWSEILAPSCAGQGVKIKVCNDCSYVAHETLDALGHTDTDADEICDTCSLALSEKADAVDKTEEEKPAEAPDEAPEEKPGSDGSESVDTSVTVINRILAFFERIMEFFESLFDFVR